MFKFSALALAPTITYRLYMTNDYSTASPQQLFEWGESLRSDQPGVWAILRGRGKSTRIAQLLGWPISKVTQEMERNQTLGIIKQTADERWALDPKSDDYEKLKVIRKLYQAVDLKLVRERFYNVEVSELCSRATEEYRKVKKEQGPRVDLEKAPSTAQMKQLRVIYRELRNEPYFTPAALGRAHGYTGPGWSRKYLESLQKSGYVELVEAPGKGNCWRLTSLGVEWAARDSNPPD